MSIIGIYSRYHRDLNLVCMLVASLIWQASDHHLDSLTMYEWFKLRGGVVGAWVGLGAGGGCGLGKIMYISEGSEKCFQIAYIIYHIS